MPARRVVAAAVIVAVPLVGAALGTTAAAAATVQEYALPGTTGPRDIVSGPGGALWVTADKAVVKLLPSGAVTRLVVGNQPYAIAPGPAGSLWFTENDEEAGGEGDGILGRISDQGVLTELPGEGLDTPAGLRDVAAGPRGTAAFVGGADGGLGIYSEGTDEDGAFSANYDLTEIGGTLNKSPNSIAAGPDGKYWYTATANPNVIGAATFGTADDDYAATYEQFALPTFPSPFGGNIAPLPDDIVAGPDGAMWFTLPFASSIGRIDVTTKAITTFKVSATSLPTGITVGPDGAIWFTDAGDTPGIGRIDPVTKAILVRTDGFSTPDAAPDRITTGPDGALWFTEPGANAVGRVEPVSFVTGLPPTTEAPPTTVVPPAPGAIAPPGTPPAPPTTPTGPAAPVPGPGDAKPAVPALRFSGFSYGVRVRAPRRARVSFRLSRAARVRVTVEGARARVRLAAAPSGRTVRGAAGVNRVTLPRLTPGRYVVRLRATAADGTTATLRARLRVLPARAAAPSFTG